MAYNTDVLENINKAWHTFKKASNTSQAKAAKALGMNQSAFSQYLRGEIPLNTDFIVKFSVLTNTEMTEFVPSNGLNHVSLQPIAVKYTLSGKELSDCYELIPSPVNLDHAYAIIVDYADFILERGTLLLIDTISDIRELDSVILLVEGSRPIYGAISYKESEWAVLEPHYFGGKRFVIEEAMQVHRVGGSYQPEKQGRVFKR